MKQFPLLLGFVLGTLHDPGSIYAQAPPPANVNVDLITSGSLTATNQFTGTVYFKEVSEVASEVTGKVVEVLFEEGDHLKEGQPMVRLDDALLKADLSRLKAEVEAAEARLAQEDARYQRTKELRDKGVTTPQEYDDIRFTATALEYRLSAARAQVARSEEELAKKTISAPFDGQVLRREAEIGDWKEEGESVAVFARDGLYDVIVQIPEQHLPFLSFGMRIPIEILGKRLEGTLVKGSPRGDPASRTFPLKIRFEGIDWLLEGMSARAEIPVSETTDCLIVPRDALLLDGGDSVVFTVEDEKAVRHVVEFVGSQGAHSVGIRSESLKPNMSVVVKGQERLKDGQPVQVLSE